MKRKLKELPESFKGTPPPEVSNFCMQFLTYFGLNLFNNTLKLLQNVLMHLQGPQLGCPLSG